MTRIRVKCAPLVRAGNPGISAPPNLELIAWHPPAHGDRVSTLSIERPIITGNIGLGAIGACISIDVLGSKYIEVSDRQPELMDHLQGKMFTLARLIDANSPYHLVRLQGIAPDSVVLTAPMRQELSAKIAARMPLSLANGGRRTPAALPPSVNDQGGGWIDYRG